MNWISTHRRFAAAMFMTVGVFMMAALSGAGASRLDAAMSACGAANPRNNVRATVDLASARMFRSHFPGETRAAPELDVDERAFVVVFEGPTMVGVFRAPGAGGSGIAAVELNDVVCVYLPPSELYPQGEPLVYFDVNLDGFLP